MIRFATQRPAVIWALSAVLLLAGAVSFTRLPLATRTSVELPRLMIGAGYPGASPEVVEAYVTSPIESAVKGVRGVRRIDSNSGDGSAQLTVHLAEGTDVQLARLAILERLELLRREFPPGVSQPYVQNYVPDGLQERPLLSLSVFGPYTPGTLQKLLDERVRPRLAAVPGVAGVTGELTTDVGVAVTYDAGLMRRIGLDPSVITSAIMNARIVTALGVQKSDGVSISVVLRDQPRLIEDLEQLPITANNKRVFRLGELATIRAEEDSRGRFFRIDGRPAVAMTVTRHPGADAIKTSAAVRATVKDVERFLPQGVTMRVDADQSTDLKLELKDLAKRGAIAFFAVLAVLAVMLRRWKAVALVMGSTLVAICGTALSLYLLDIPANLLTLAGLGMGVGILVQNALVVVERLTTEPDTPDGRAKAAVRITPAIAGSTLTTIVVLFPFLYLQGNARAAFVPFALAFIFALLWSVFGALVVVPALGKGGGATIAGWRRTRQLYEWLLRKLLKHRLLTLGTATAVLAVLGWGFITKVPRSSWGFYGERRSTLGVSLSFPRGSEPTQVDEAMKEFESLVVGRPDVEQVRTRGFPTSAQMTVVFTRKGGMTSAPLQLQELLTQRAILVGGAQISVYGEGPAFSSGGSRTISTFHVKILGYSYQGVADIAEDLKRRLELIVRVRDVLVSSAMYSAGDRAMSITAVPDRNALARYGIDASQLNAAVAREIRGSGGSQLLEIDGDEVRLNVKASGTRERTVTELGDALIPNARGIPARISDVSEIQERESLNSIVREDQQYMRVVRYDFRGSERLAKRTHNAFMETVAVPAGYTIEDMTGRYGFSQDDSGRLLWLVFAVGVALVVLSVALVFDSIWSTVIVFLSLPLSAAGVAAAFWSTGSAFTREAAVGVILVVGIAVNQAILIVDAALAERRKRSIASGPTKLLENDIIAASLDRAGMIVMVTFAALASLIPLSAGTDASTLFGAIALATAGGTVFGTLSALFVVPAMMLGRRPRRKGTGRWKRFIPRVFKRGGRLWIGRLKPAWLKWPGLPGLPGLGRRGRRQAPPGHPGGEAHQVL